jgi:DHA3 family tetracycline resistance protein-like MFS transporter
MHPIKFYQAHSFLTQFGSSLCVGLYIPYLQHLGLSRSDIFLVNAVFWLAIAATEIPTGTLADGLSRRWSLRAGLGFWIFGTLTYATASLVEAKWAILAIAILAEILEGIGSSFLSGASQAWISDALEKEGRQSEQAAVMGKAARWGYTGLLSGGAISFALVDLGYAAGWIIRALALGASLVVCLRYMGQEGELETKTSKEQSFKDSWNALRGDRGLKWAAFGGIAFGFVIPFNLTWVPHFTDELGRPMAAAVWIGVVSGLVLGALVIERSRAVQANPVHSLPFALGLAGCGLALLGLADGIYLPLLLVALHEIGRGMVNPLIDNFVCERVGGTFKATYGSLQSMVSRGGFAVILGAQWLAMEGYFPQATDKTLWWASGTVLAAAAGALWITRGKSKAMSLDKSRSLG